MTEKHPILLGNFVRSDVYDIEGIAVSFYHHSPDRVPQICVQPRSTDAVKVADAQYMDLNLVDYVNDGVVDRLIPLIHNPFTYGDEVKDRISGYKGVVTGWIEMMNGCIDIQISANFLNKNGKTVGAVLYEIGRVVKIVNDDKPVSNKRSIVDKVKGVLSQETHTTDPAERPTVKTGSAMHNGKHMRRG